MTWINTIFLKSELIADQKFQATFLIFHQWGPLLSLSKFPHFKSYISFFFFFWLIRAAEHETSSISFPSKTSSSFTFSDRRIVTPSSISTFQTFFSPRKFWILMEQLELVMEALMGKWADTNLILYRYPLVTLVIRFSTWLSMVRVTAEVFLDPNHAPIFSVLFPMVSSFRSWKSRLRCLKLWVNFPHGPSTSITFACTFIFTPSGISIVSEDTIIFISLLLHLLLLLLRSQLSTPPHNPNPSPSNSQCLLYFLVFTES